MSTLIYICFFKVRGSMNGGSIQLEGPKGNVATLATILREYICKAAETVDSFTFFCNERYLKKVMDKISDIWKFILSYLL